MPAWKEQHYARAEQFVRLLEELIGAPPAPPARPKSDAAPTPPIPVPPRAPSPAAPTAASVFKSIPWKK